MVATHPATSTVTLDLKASQDAWTATTQGNKEVVMMVEVQDSGHSVVQECVLAVDEKKITH